MRTNKNEIAICVVIIYCVLWSGSVSVSPYKRPGAATSRENQLVEASGPLARRGATGSSGVFPRLPPPPYQQVRPGGGRLLAARQLPPVAASRRFLFLSGITDTMAFILPVTNLRFFHGPVYSLFGTLFSSRALNKVDPQRFHRAQPWTRRAELK